MYITARALVSEMTYTVPSGMLYCSIPYQTVRYDDDDNVDISILHSVRCCVILQVVKDDIAQLSEASFDDAVDRKKLQAGDSRAELEASFDEVVDQELLGAGDAGANDVQKPAADVRTNAAVFALSLKLHPMATDNIEKVQSDRF